MCLHFFHTMALALWVGGIVAIGILVAPAAFSEAPTRAVAGRIVGLSLQRFDRVVMGCIVALLATSALLIHWYGRWSAWYAIEYTCIVLMSASALFSMFVLSPRLRRLRLRRERTLAEESASEPATGTGDYGEEFDRLHRLSVVAMQFNLACGTIAILFS
jgi:uncharacterized membrane protein